jgi:hypothetical protein
MSVKRVELSKLDILVYKGMEIDRTVLDAIVDNDKRLLWAFVSSADGTAVRAIPYSESHVIWMTEEDVLKEQDVEI